MKYNLSYIFNKNIGNDRFFNFSKESSCVDDL